jgi:predicted HTH transcriptional regulator
VTREQLRTLLEQEESRRLEFKHHLPKESRRIAELAAAFANTEGGTAVFGFDGDSRSIVGLAHPQRDSDRIEEALRAVAPPLTVDLETIELDGMDLIALHVPKSDEFPHVAHGRVLQREADRVVPLTSSLILERISESDESPEEEERRLAEAIQAQGQRIDELVAAAGWRRQLPVQLAFLFGGTVLGYVLGGWNPLSL